MNKQIGKNMFDGMELPEQAKQEVWGNLESIISNTTVEKRVHKNRVWVRRLGKTAAAFLIMGVLFGTINGVSHGGLVEAISGLWQTDESSQKIVTEMTDYHVRLDSVYAPEILECTEKRLIFAGSFGLVIYDRQSERVAATIDLQKIESKDVYKRQEPKKWKKRKLVHSLSWYRELQPQLMHCLLGLRLRSTILLWHLRVL